MTLLALLLLAASLAQEPDDLVRAALDAHPDVTAALARRVALERAADVAGAWSDPMLSLEYSNAPVDSFDISRHPMGGVQVRLQQAFPTSGTPLARRAVAEARVDEATHALDETRVQLEGAVRMAWWRLCEVRLLREVTTRHRDAARELVDAVRARYEVGQAAQHELLRLSVLAERLEDDLGDFARDEAALRAELVRATGQDGPFPTPPSVQPLPLDEDVATWMDEATRQRPALQVLAARIATSEARATVARRSGLPDLTVWAGYRVRAFQSPTDPGTDFLMLGVSTPLPVGGVRRGRQEASSALADKAADEARLLAAQDALTAELDATAAAWRRAHDKAVRYTDGLLPAARQGLETTLADYRVGRADVASLFQAEVQLFDLERAVLRAAVETHVRAAAAATLLGRALTQQALE